MRIERALRVSIAMAVLVISASAPVLAASNHGKVKKKVYYSPASNFSVPVPGGPGMRIDDWHEENMGSVSFSDDFGSAKSVFYTKLPPDFVEKLAQPTFLENALMKWLHDVAMPTWIVSFSPKASVVHEAFSSFEETPAVLAEVVMPEGSTLVDMKSGKRMDSKRGLVIFARGQCIYMIMTQRSGGLGSILDQALSRSSAPEPRDQPDDSQWMQFATDLVPFYRSVSFTEVGGLPTADEKREDH